MAYNKTIKTRVVCLLARLKKKKKVFSDIKSSQAGVYNMVDKPGLDSSKPVCDMSDSSSCL